MTELQKLTEACGAATRDAFMADATSRDVYTARDITIAAWNAGGADDADVEAAWCASKAATNASAAAQRVLKSTEAALVDYYKANQTGET